MASAGTAAFPAEGEQVAAGKNNPDCKSETGPKQEASLKRDEPVKRSPVIRAIAAAEKGTTGEIRVHLSKKWFEPDPFARATKLFHRFGMTKTAQRNAVLIYVNLRRKKFALIGDEGIHKVVGQDYWNGLAEALRNDLRSCSTEDAIALAVRTVGATLQRFFPADLDVENPNELPDEMTQD